jgi:hypothetical protein
MEDCQPSKREPTKKMTTRLIKEVYDMSGSTGRRLERRRRCAIAEEFGNKANAQLVSLSPFGRFSWCFLVWWYQKDEDKLLLVMVPPCTK